MRTLKIVCILFCLWSVVSIFTGSIFTFSSPSGQIEMRHYGSGTFYSVANALMFALAYYGIHRRAPIVWKLGWGFLAILYLEFLIQALSSSVKQPQGWIASIAIAIGSLLVALYWGFWWKRQRSFFGSEHQEPPKHD